LGKFLPSTPSIQILTIFRTLTAGQFAIYGDIKKALGATGGVDIAK
jgi:hypothetical protein